MEQQGFQKGQDVNDISGSGLWTKNTAFWARNRGTKKGAVWLRP